MCTFRLSLCFTIAILALTLDVSAQSSSHRVRSSERAARANWQPTRSRVPVQPASHQEATDSAQRGRLRTVDHHNEVESELQPPDVSIMEDADEAPMPVEPMPRSAAPLDGQITLEPIRGHNAAAGTCGCGDAMCVGGCDSGCDSIGCASAPTCCGSCNSCGTGGCVTCGELCSDRAWRPCITLCIPQDGWVSVEYLGWFQDGMSLPPLVTTSTDPNVDFDDAGVLGRPTTRVLFGGDKVLDDGIDGARLRFGVWLDRCHTWGVGAELFEIGSEREGLIASSNGTPILARPFFSTRSGQEAAELVAFPDELSGTVTAVAESRFSGASVNFRFLTCCSEGCGRFLFCGCPEKYCSRTMALIGYRYLELDERVVITEDLISNRPNEPGGFDIVDAFDARNQFNGFDIGWMYRRNRGFWTCETMLRIAIGNTRQTVAINGQTVINDPASNPTVQTFQGGLLTQTSNIGVYTNNEFSVVPEFNINCGYQLTDHLRCMLGYTFIYWSNVARPGDQIDLDVNPALLPPPQQGGAQRPTFAFDTTDFWAQGINFGLEYRW